MIMEASEFEAEEIDLFTVFPPIRHVVELFCQHKHR